MGALIPLLGLLSLLLGVNWLATPWRTIGSVWAARHWASTEGETESAAIETLRGGQHPRHYPRISYRYAVGGQTFTGTAVCFGALRNSLGAAEAVLDRYPARHYVTVWYDPANPARSVLERRFDAANLLANAALATLTLGFGCAMIVLGITA